VLAVDDRPPEGRMPVSKQVRPQEQASQEMRHKATVLVFFTVFLTLILAAKELNL
jgi:hypothetical protein